MKHKKFDFKKLTKLVETSDATRKTFCAISQAIASNLMQILITYKRKSIVIAGITSSE
jgi:NADH:ubiquinone oxidoreductase subunit F (NADH-binding)